MIRSPASSSMAFWALDFRASPKPPNSTSSRRPPVAAPGAPWCPTARGCSASFWPSQPRRTARSPSAAGRAITSWPGRSLLSAMCKTARRAIGSYRCTALRRTGSISISAPRVVVLSWTPGPRWWGFPQRWGISWLICYGFQPHQQATASVRGRAWRSTWATSRSCWTQWTLPAWNSSTRSKECPIRMSPTRLRHQLYKKLWAVTTSCSW
mmetsp:Transcript_3143/g.5533  ORF Transcript_3143/g.5533 Transcript_3143/m.5533 type:complete len:210 (+) Transcript_3143:910-1539(+)